MFDYHESCRKWKNQNLNLHLIVLKNPEGHISLEELEKEVRRIGILLNVIICALGGHMVQRHVFAARMRLN